MLDALVNALVVSKNEAADDVLLEAMAIGDDRERHIALGALVRRATVRGLGGVVERYQSLPEALQLEVLGKIRTFHHALRECGRSDRTELRLAAMKLIALGRQGKLAYVLCENLHESDETVSKAATEALVALARWVATETRGLQRRGEEERHEGTEARRHEGEERELKDDGTRVPAGHAETIAPTVSSQAASSSLRASVPSCLRASALYLQLMAERPEIEAAVARAMDVHRGRHGPDLLRAGLLLADWPGSKTLGILSTNKHGAQSSMLRRLQQPPASEHVEAFLLAASHAQLRSHFGMIFSHIEEAPVLDAVLRKTYWLKDHQLQLCMHQVTRGTWYIPGELRRDLERRPPEDAAKIGEWLAVSGLSEPVMDERMEDLLRHCKDSTESRLRLFRIAMRKKRDAPVRLFLGMLSDPDERILRMAAREMVRRKPKDYESVLLQLMTNSPESVRRVISRAIGQAGFDQFWQRFDKLDRATRKQAGRAMLKLLPDSIARLQRRLISGPVEQRTKAMQMAQELGLSDQLRDTLVLLCNDPHPRLRSKAVMSVGRMTGVPPELLVDRLLNDSDARVRANAIEVLENKAHGKLLEVLVQRARAANNRERANAIKALHCMKVGGVSDQLLNMLRDERPQHRISAMWTMNKVGLWKLLAEVGTLAKSDSDQRVRRYALTVLRSVADLARTQRLRNAG
jgi:HEAT repeat protein